MTPCHHEIENHQPGLPPAWRSGLALAGWLALVYSASATAIFIDTGDWYAELAKPAWNPPNWVFGPAWTLLYALMAISAWRVWRQGGWALQKTALGLFLLQWVLNAVWTPLFFGWHQVGGALIEIVLLLAAILATIRAFWRVDRPAGTLLLPYAAWVAFATALNSAIWLMN